MTTAPAPADDLHTTAPRFRLLRSFTIATLCALAAVAAALVVLQGMEEDFFDQVQRQQLSGFSKSQAELARQQEQAARASLLAAHEASHVNLTRVVSNMMWTSDFAPLVAQAQRFDVAPCRAMDSEAGTSPKSAEAGARRACLAAMGQRIVALPAFKSVDAKAYAAMRSSQVFKIKVWDLRGVTVYSSQHDQIGDDGSANLGWRTAANGKPASELTHRDRFSAFEGMVENRDLISSYIPVRDESGSVVGVFELYSDVTPMLEQIKSAARRFSEISADNESRLARSAGDNLGKVHSSSDRFLAIVGALLVVLCIVSLAIVAIGQRIIDRQARAQEHAARRERQWHQDKMAALAAMADNVAHEVGNPLAIISALAQQLPPADASMPDGFDPARAIVDQSERIARMMRQIADFASVRNREKEWVDVNEKLRAVCELQRFDRRLQGTPIDWLGGQGLPARLLVVDRLYETMLGLLPVCAESARSQDPKARLLVETLAAGDDVVMRLSARRPGTAGADSVVLPPVDDARLESVRQLVARMGAGLERDEAGLRITLPGPSAKAG